MIRALLKRDLSRVQEIHQKFYQREFRLDEVQRFITSFVSVGSDDKAIVAGGVRSIAEAIIVTDKDVKIEDRIDALSEWFNTAKNVTRESGYDELHVFIQDEKWLRHLIKHGFVHTVGSSLVVGVK